VEVLTTDVSVTEISENIYMYIHKSDAGSENPFQLF
jgi:hypothetical protein